MAGGGPAREHGTRRGQLRQGHHGSNREQRCGTCPHVTRVGSHAPDATQLPTPPHRRHCRLPDPALTAATCSPLRMLPPTVAARWFCNALVRTSPCIAGCPLQLGPMEGGVSPCATSRHFRRQMGITIHDAEDCVGPGSNSIASSTVSPSESESCTDRNPGRGLNPVMVNHRARVTRPQNPTSRTTIRRPLGATAGTASPTVRCANWAENFDCPSLATSSTHDRARRLYNASVTEIRTPGEASLAFGPNVVGRTRVTHSRHLGAIFLDCNRPW